MNDNQQHEIDRYVLGRMTADERRDFEQRMEHDEALRSQCAFTQDVRDALVSRQEKLRQMRRWDMLAFVRRWQVAAACLSGVAAVVFCFFLFTPKRTLPPFNADSIELWRGGTDLQQIARLVSARQYSEALTLITRAETVVLQPVDTTGLTFEARQYECQAQQLEADHLRWLKVYALNGLGRDDEALQLLRSLSEHPGHYQHTADSICQRWK